MSAREQLKALEKKRSDLEIEIKHLLQTIPEEFRDTTQRPKYTDCDGYPRADIDVWRIAEIRKKVVKLQNDHIFMMKDIEKLLMSAFASSSNNEQINEEEKKEKEKEKENKEKKDIISNMKAFMKANNEQKDDENKEKNEKNNLNALKPFYCIDKIFEDSPSHCAGLKCGDLIIKFGSMTFENQSPQMMQNIVKQSINKQIPVVIKRNPEGVATLNLVPKKWNGRGLLGCHLTPYPQK